MSLADLVRLKARRTFGEHLPGALVENLTPDRQALAVVRAGEGRGSPIAMLEDGDHRWTLLTDSHLVGLTTLGVRAIRLEAIREDYEVRGDLGDEKALLNQVSYDGETWFRAPSAENLMLLLNVLLSAARKNKSVGV